MRLKYDLIVFDLEANQPSGKIIEIGAVKFTREGEIKDQFQVFVNPLEKMDPYVRKLCGITDADVQGGVDLATAVSQFYAWATAESKNVLLCAWGNYDIAELRQQCKEERIEFPFRGKGIDAKSVAVWVTAMMKKPISSDGLTTMMNGWGVLFDNALGNRHRGLGDAYNTARLLQRIWREYEEKTIMLRKGLEDLGVK